MAINFPRLERCTPQPICPEPVLSEIVAFNKALQVALVTALPALHPSPLGGRLDIRERLASQSNARKLFVQMRPVHKDLTVLLYQAAAKESFGRALEKLACELMKSLLECIQWGAGCKNPLVDQLPISGQALEYLLGLPGVDKAEKESAFLRAFRLKGFEPKLCGANLSEIRANLMDQAKKASVNKRRKTDRILKKVKMTLTPDEYQFLLEQGNLSL